MPPAAAPLPCVRLLATGGTIAGAHTTGRGYRAAALSIDALVAAVPQLATLARIDVEQVAKLGSQDMTEAVWRKLAARVQRAVDDPALTGVVITHGTDTMEETAYFLNLVVRTDKSVVLVGAMRPATAMSADGPMNLFNAMAVATAPAARSRGVLVVANDEIHFAREVAKTNTTQLGTFASGQRGLAGLVNSGRPHFYAAPVRRHTAASEFSSESVLSGTGVPPVVRAGLARRKPAPLPPLPRVDLIFAHAGMDRALIDAAVAAGARGLVIAGVGDGNLGATALAACAAAAKKGVAIVRASRTGGGVVERNIEIDDDRLGFIAADELNPQKARVLLMLGLTRTRDPRALQDMFFAY